MPLLISQRGRRFMDLPNRAQGFASRSAGAASRAARGATETSRMVYSSYHSGRPLVPPRPGRPTTMGAFPSLLEWTAIDGVVSFNVGLLEAKAPYWIIQEIGTGQEARVGLIGGKEMSVEVPSQDGRDLPDGFIWADGAVSLMSEGGKFQSVVGGTSRRVGASKRRVPAPFGHGRDRPGMMDQQNLYPIAMLPPGQAYRQTRGVIHREIKGKHFVRDGGIEGNSLLRSALLSDFEDTFR